MSHTKEPWFVVPGGRHDLEFIITTQRRLDGSKGEICGMDVEFTGPHGDEQKANARRIVACVNALAGVSTEELEQSGFIGGLLEQVECSTITRDNMEGRLNIATVKLAAMMAQRDELKAQLAEANDDYKAVDALYRDATDYGQAQHMELLEVRSQLAEAKADAAPEGYVFFSADFSRQAAGHSQFGTVTFIRNKVGRQWWHELPEEQQEITSLHIYGKGTTVIEAMRHAAMKGATE